LRRYGNRNCNQIACPQAHIGYPGNQTACPQAHIGYPGNQTACPQAHIGYPGQPPWRVTN
jgi:hypothetical protein